MHEIFSATESADLEYLRSVVLRDGGGVAQLQDSNGNTALHYALVHVQFRPHFNKVRPPGLVGARVRGCARVGPGRGWGVGTGV